MKNLVVIFISKLIPLINKTYNYFKGSNDLKNNNQNTKKNFWISIENVQNENE